MGGRLAQADRPCRHAAQSAGRLGRKAVAGRHRRDRGRWQHIPGRRAPHVKKVVIANPKQVRVIACARIKTDTIDAGVLAQLHAGGFLQKIRFPDEPAQALHRQVTRVVGSSGKDRA